VSRIALVTGAARGIGAATVLSLVDQGWRVVAVDRCEDIPGLPYAMATPDDLARVAKAGGDAVVTVQADAGDLDAMGKAVSLAETRFGGLDAAIAAAGVIAGGAPAWEVPQTHERIVLSVNLEAVMTLARVAIPALLARPEPRTGRFIAITSAAASRGLPTLAAYCASKAGVAGFIRALAVELRDSGVTANSVSPGSTATVMLEESARLYGLPSPEQFGEQQPLGRLLRPEEVASIVTFVAGLGSTGMTGADVPIDGGMSL
jgi:SDR family mycofactocin-dependent oxidoreductase